MLWSARTQKTSRFFGGPAVSTAVRTALIDAARRQATAALRAEAAELAADAQERAEAAQVVRDMEALRAW